MAGQVWHRRQEAVAHAFAYPLSLLLVDLTRADAESLPGWLFGKRWRPITLRDRDYVNDAPDSLLEKVRERAGAEGLDFSRGCVWMLAQPRALGFLFNPIVLYFHVPEGASAPDGVLAEVRNTPWGERHFYGYAQAEPADRLVFDHAKAFHVSPFLPMELRYHWQIDWSDPLRVRIWAREGTRTVFAAGMALSAIEPRGVRSVRPLMRLLFQGLVTRVRIYAQALRLWRRGAGFYRHPEKIVKEGS
jgi:hypothetical protein